jgi:ribosome-binding factor A
MSSRNDSPKHGYRASRLEKSVAEAFETSLLPSLSDPLLQDLHVFSVEVAGTLSCVRVLLVPSQAPAYSEEDVSAALKRIESRLRAELAEMLRIKRMPHLRLKYLPLPMWQGGEK